MYKEKDFTYGVELEYGNVYCHQPLPEGSSWNRKDNTCVSTTGIANDPLGELYKYGGEINTKPSSTIDEQIQIIEEINACLEPNPVVNYRSNLHLHIRVPGLNEDLETCKKVLQYVDRYQQEAFNICESIPKPVGVKGNERFEWAMKRYKRRQKSHQYCLPEARVKEMMEAKSTQEFFEAHAPLGTNGQRMWFFSPRAGINLRQMWEGTNTIEFRHFPGTLNMKEMRTCLEWCKDFLIEALSGFDGATPRELYFHTKDWKYHPDNFPSFQPYEFETEQVYQFTNFDKNSRKVVSNRLSKIREKFDIDDLSTSSVDVYNFIKPLMND